LIAGILDNTLNFKASVTDSRDHAAYDELIKYADLPSDWPSVYFSECQQTIEQDVTGALRNDTKQVQYPGLEHEIAVAQLVVWDAKFALDRVPTITSVMRANKEWFVNVVSISEGKNYLICEDPEVQAHHHKILDVDFDNNVGVTGRLWLRKEIMKRAMELYI